MMVMMIMNIVFLKLILSAMDNVTSGSVLIWLCLCHSFNKSGAEN